MGAVFVSYRRGDSEGQARALGLTLAQHVGSDAVFLDVDDIAPGLDFRRVLDEHLASCSLMLALIGKDWLDAKDAAGQRRLDDPRDYVRQEIAAALKRDILVTPVLLQGVSMPPADRLPDDIRDLAYRNALELRHSSWESDVNEMVRRLGLVRSTRRYWTGAVAAAALVAVAAWAVWSFSPFATRQSDARDSTRAQGGESPAPSPQPAVGAAPGPAPQAASGVGTAPSASSVLGASDEARVRERLVEWRRTVLENQIKYGERWRQALVDDPRDEITGAVDPGMCTLSSTAADTAIASCELTVAKRGSGKSEFLSVQWAYADAYTQNLRLVKKDTVWAITPQAPVIKTSEKQQRVRYQQQIRQALTRWLSELRSGELPRMRRASPQIDRAVAVAGATCDVRLSAPTGATCAFTAQPALPARGRGAPREQQASLRGVNQQGYTQALVFESVKDGVWAAVPAPQR